MHRCLQLPEILETILEYAMFENGRRKTDSVAVMARTCWAISHLALPILWKEQTSLVPLLKCLPSDTWTIERSSMHSTFKGIFRLSKIPKGSDWDRVFHYADFIRYLGADSVRPFHINESVFSAIQYHLPRKWLLPNLKELTRSLSGDDYHHVHSTTLFGPNIVSFSWTRVFQPIPIGDTVTLLAILHKQSPVLKKLDIQHVARVGNNVPVFPQFWKAVASFKHLQDLSCPTNSITYSLLHSYILPLRNLRSLDLLLDGNSPFSSVPGDVIALPLLETVQVHIPEADSLIPLTKLIASSPVSTLKIAVDGSPSAINEEFFSALQTPSLLVNLETLMLMGSYRSDEGRSPALSCQTLRPLLSFHGLRNLFLRPDFASELDNSLLKDMADSWPNLNTLCFPTFFEWDNCEVTLAGLVPLAERCQKLCMLAVPINGRTELDVDAIQNIVTGDNSLVILDVGFSPVLDPECSSVTQFISRLFPKLKRIVAEGDKIHVERWYHIARSIEETHSHLLDL